MVYGEYMTSTRTLEIATSSLRDIRRVLVATGVSIVSELPTPNAVGYTTITIAKDFS